MKNNFSARSDEFYIQTILAVVFISILFCGYQSGNKVSGMPAVKDQQSVRKV